MLTSLTELTRNIDKFYNELNLIKVPSPGLAGNVKVGYLGFTCNPEVKYLHRNLLVPSPNVLPTHFSTRFKLFSTATISSCCQWTTIIYREMLR